MAERHPRDFDVVRERLLKDCRRYGFAKEARYAIKNRGDGWTIRFAEAAIRLMGNVATDQMTIYDDSEKRIVRVTVVDCETNTPYSSDVMMEKTVERKSTKDGDEVLGSRLNSYGKMVYRIVANEDDLIVKQNALVSKAIRTNGLRLVPSDILADCEAVVANTLANQDAKDPDAAKRNLFDSFGKLGVSVEQLKTLLGHDADSLTPAELTSLRGLYSAIRDGETTWREIVEANTPARGPEDRPAQTKNPTDLIKERLASKSEEKRVRSMTTGSTQVKPEEIWPKPEGETNG